MRITKYDNFFIIMLAYATKISREFSFTRDNASVQHINSVIAKNRRPDYTGFCNNSFTRHCIWIQVPRFFVNLCPSWK